MLNQLNYTMLLAALFFSSIAVSEDDLSFPQTKAQWIKALSLDVPSNISRNVNSKARFGDKGMVSKGLCQRARIIVRFDSNLAVVPNNSALNELGAALIAHPNNVVKVEGHTDDKGAEEYNLKLSKRRAAAVRNYLVKNYRIAKQRLPVVGYGESKPSYDNATKEGQALNRRVEFCKI